MEILQTAYMCKAILVNYWSSKDILQTAHMCKANLINN